MASETSGLTAMTCQKFPGGSSEGDTMPGGALGGSAALAAGFSGGRRLRTLGGLGGGLRLGILRRLLGRRVPVTGRARAGGEEGCGRASAALVTDEPALVSDASLGRARRVLADDIAHREGDREEQDDDKEAAEELFVAHYQFEFAGVVVSHGLRSSRCSPAISSPIERTAQ